MKKCNEIKTNNVVKLDIPEFLKGSVKEYVRIEKTEYMQMIEHFKDARQIAYTNGLLTGVFTVTLLTIITAIVVYVIQFGSLGTLPVAGP